MKTLPIKKMINYSEESCLKNDAESKELLEIVTELKFTVTKGLGMEKKVKEENLQESINSCWIFTDKIDDLNV